MEQLSKLESYKNILQNIYVKIFNKMVLLNFPNMGTYFYRFKKYKAKQKQRKPSRHIRIKILTTKDYEKILKGGIEKTQITYMGTTIQITTNLSEKKRARR